MIMTFRKTVPLIQNMIHHRFLFQ